MSFGNFIHIFNTLTKRFLARFIPHIIRPNLLTPSNDEPLIDLAASPPPDVVAATPLPDAVAATPLPDAVEAGPSGEQEN